MPPRWFSALIVASWLAATGWLFWHDLWPKWRPGEPPEFYIDLVEEVQNSDRLNTTWTVQRQTKDEEQLRDIFRATTWVDYQPEDDTFTLHARLTSKGGSPKKENSVALLGFAVKSMTSEYRVTRTGQLRELKTRLSFINVPKETARRPNENLEEVAQFLLEGKVRDDRFFLHCSVGGALLAKDVKMDLPPTSVSHNASVLLPLHPVNRIHGLRLGQSWRQPLVDPFRDAFDSLLGSAGAHYINAHVLPQPQILKRDDGTETTCLVIEYDEEGQLAGRTWVEQDSERVEQQEALREGDRWLMKRDNSRNPLRRPF
jgi:hypothetical protein